MKILFIGSVLLLTVCIYIYIYIYIFLARIPQFVLDNGGKGRRNNDKREKNWQSGEN